MLPIFAVLGGDHVENEINRHAASANHGQLLGKPLHCCVEADLGAIENRSILKLVFNVLCYINRSSEFRNKVTRISERNLCLLHKRQLVQGFRHR